MTEPPPPPLPLNAANPPHDDLRKMKATDRRRQAWANAPDTVTHGANNWSRQQFIGRGGFGVVMAYQGSHSAMPMEVAVKLMMTRTGDDLTARREIAQIQHEANVGPNFG